MGFEPTTPGLKGCRPYGPMYRVAPASEKSPNEGFSASGLLVASRLLLTIGFYRDHWSPASGALCLGSLCCAFRIYPKLQMP